MPLDNPPASRLASVSRLAAPVSASDSTEEVPRRPVTSIEFQRRAVRRPEPTLTAVGTGAFRYVIVRSRHACVTLRTRTAPVPPSG